MTRVSTDARRFGDIASSRLAHTCGTGPRLSFFAACLAGALMMPSFGVAAVITGTRTEGPNVTVSSDSTGLTATVGRWDTPYNQGLCGNSIEGAEPTAESKLFVSIDVQDGGVLTFTYEYITYDSPAHFTVQFGSYDQFFSVLGAPSGIPADVNPIPTITGPNQECWGDLWSSGPVTISQSLNGWAHQTVTLVFDVVQDGYGDQSQARITGLAIRTCSVPPLAPLSAAAQAFENDSTRVDTLNMTSATQAALACFRASVDSAGGQVKLKSAFRPPDYQLHLQDVYNKWQALMGNHQPECAALRSQVHAELMKHDMTTLTVQPAGPHGPHVQGIAFDANVTAANMDTLAAHCGLFRPFPRPCTPPAPRCDPTHYQLR